MPAAPACVAIRLSRRERYASATAARAAMSASMVASLARASNAIASGILAFNPGMTALRPPAKPKPAIARSRAIVS